MTPVRELTKYFHHTKARPTCVVAALFLFVRFILFPPFFSYDSLHYLNLSLYPVFGDSHPVGFGVLLRAFHESSIFLNLFALSQAYALYVIFFLPWLSSKPGGTETKRSPILRTAICMSWLFTLPGLLFLTNAMWSEMTAFLVIGLFARVIHSLEVAISQPSRLVYVLSTILSLASLTLLGYLIRYQLVLLPVALLTTGVLLALKSWIKKAAVRTSIKRLYAYGTVLPLSFGLIVLSDSVLKANFPTKTEKNAITLHGIRTSIQCTLRCDVRLYDVSCESNEGRSLITETKCSEFLFGLKSLGNPLDDDKLGLAAVGKRVGPLLLLRWIATAPLLYFRDSHAMEVEGFDFVALPSSRHFPEATKYFSSSLNDGKESYTFKALHRVLGKLFSNRIYHGATVVLLMLAVCMLVFSESLIPTFFFTYGVGTFLAFAYLNPEIPFRFLIQILGPLSAGLFLL